MTLNDCAPGDFPVMTAAMDGKPWQLRAKKAGLSQKLLARLSGQAENTVSRQLGEKFEAGVPQYVKAIIWAWERLPQKDREAMLAAADEAYEE